MYVLGAVNAELVVYGVVHSADGGDGLAYLITETIGLVEKLDMVASGLGQAEEPGGIAKDSSERITHGCHCSYRPDEVKDKSHNYQREQDANKTIAGGSKFSGSGKTFECYKVKSEGDLQSDVIELTPCGYPG
jgi:hypothetical protein